MNRTTFLAALATASGLAAIAAPAHASLNDQFVCATGDARMIHVTIMASDPGSAILSQRADSAAEPRERTLTGAATASAFRFEGKGVRFAGSDTVGLLELSGERLECHLPGEPGASEPGALTTDVIGDGEGLIVRRYDTGEDTRLAFGMQRRALIAALTPHLGRPEPLVANSECGAGPMEFQRFGRLEVNFQDGMFVGWSMQASMQGAAEPNPATGISLSDGTRPGEAGDWIVRTFERVEDSTLGAEYYSDGVIAIIDEPSGTVDLLMGGTTCVFR